MELKVYVAVLGPVGTNCYIAINDETKKAIIVDAAANPERLIRAVEKHGATLEALLLTHAHWDHTAAVNELLEMMPELPVYIGENEASLLADPTFNVSRWLDGTAGSVDPSKVKTVHDGEEMSLITMPSIILVIGVNGVGKTTSIGKLAASEDSICRRYIISGKYRTFRSSDGR